MSTFYLIRHGTNDYLGKALAGRLPNISLNEQGRQEAERLARDLAAKGIQRILSSPLERARETAGPLARRLGLSVELLEAVNEVDFGDWAGRSMDELNRSEHWLRFNACRSATRAPNGETMLEIQNRVVGAIEKLDGTASTLAIFGHADPLKLALIHYLGMPIDLMARLELSPGGYSVLELETRGPRVLCVNHLPPP